MSASASPVFSAIAFQLAACLDGYVEEVEGLLRAPHDLVAYQGVSRRMDEMRLYSASLPQLSVAWVELLIRHFEFTHALWRMQRAACEPAELHHLHGRLKEAADLLSRKATQLLASA